MTWPKLSARFLSLGAQGNAVEIGSSSAPSRLLASLAVSFQPPLQCPGSVG